MKKIKVIKNGKEDKRTKRDPDIVFRVIQKDTIGRSASNPTWGDVYKIKDGQQIYVGVGLYKEFDYDFPKAAYAEKIWSILGKRILEGVKVPDIDIVEETSQNPALISYRLLDNDKEDLIHIRDILFNKFEREDLKKKNDIFHIKDILECVKMQVGNEEEYKKIEKAVMQILLLDSVTNNGDRHANNWALIRDKSKNRYDIAVYDHSSAFVDMLEKQSKFTVGGWSSSYLITNKEQRKKGIGSTGENIVRYIYKNYREYFDDFYLKFEANLPYCIEEILNESLEIDVKRLIDRLNERRRYLRVLYREKDEVEYE